MGQCGSKVLPAHATRLRLTQSGIGGGASPWQTMPPLRLTNWRLTPPLRLSRKRAHAISSTAAWVPRRCPSLAIRDSRRCLSLEERDARRCLSRAVRSAHTERGSRGAERTDHAPRGSRGGAHAIADHAWERVGVHRESVATPCHISRPTLVHRLSGRRVLKGLNSVTGRDRPQRGLRGPASSRTAILSPQYKHELLSPSGS